MVSSTKAQAAVWLVRDFGLLEPGSVHLVCISKPNVLLCLFTSVRRGS